MSPVYTMESTPTKRSLSTVVTLPYEATPVVPGLVRQARCFAPHDGLTAHSRALRSKRRTRPPTRSQSRGFRVDVVHGITPSPGTDSNAGIDHRSTPTFPLAFDPSSRKHPTSGKGGAARIIGTHGLCQTHRPAPFDRHPHRFPRPPIARFRTAFPIVATPSRSTQ